MEAKAQGVQIIGQGHTVNEIRKADKMTDQHIQVDYLWS